MGWMKCELCGKADESVIHALWCGTNAHPKCAEIAKKAYKLYLQTLLADPNGLMLLSNHIIQIEKEERE